ncbi:hypothetical protein cpx_00024 [Clostridium phage cpx]|nr:hypothetical protein cpx_00024 [Clostridium phage cpx]
MLIRCKENISLSIRKGMTFEVVNISEDMYQIKYHNVSNKRTWCQWFLKDNFEVVNDIVVNGQPGIEMVEHPKHYNKGIEVWDFTDSWGMDFLEGNIIKYVTRYKYKNGVEDLKKAKQFIERLIEREEKENEGIEE